MSEEVKDVRKKVSLFTEVMKNLKILIWNQKLLKKLFWSGNITSNINNAGEIFKPITEEEIHVCMGEFMDYMNPRCQIYGCAVCGIRITASSKELIRKITVNNLEILKSTSKEIEDHLVIPGKYRNIKGVTKFDANDNQSYDPAYFALHKWYLQDEIGDNSILNVRALLCKTCKKDIDSKKVQNIR
jgi:hypothetical protein